MSDFRAPIFAIPPLLMKRFPKWPHRARVTHTVEVAKFQFFPFRTHTVMSTQNMTQRAITNTHTYTLSHTETVVTVTHESRADALG